MRMPALLVSTAAVIVGVISVAHADVIYSDNFDRTVGDVAGRTPDLATGLHGGTAAATWTSDASTTTTTPANGTTADAVFTASGGTATATDSTFASAGALATGADANLITNATLPFTPITGNVYDYHMDVLPSGAGASGNWLAMAFATAGLNGHTTSGTSSALSNDNAYGLIILKGSGTTQAFAGVGTGSGQTLLNATNLTSASGSTFNSVDIILNTTGTNWTLNWKLNGTTELATPYTYGTNPNIGLVVFGTNKLTGEVSNFSLTTTPEPASIALLGLGGLTALRRRRV